MNKHVCPWWLAYTFDNPLRRFLHDPRQLLAAYVRPGMTVADLGCGLGYFSIGMAGLVGGDGRVLAVDLQPKMLEKAARRAAAAGVGERISFLPCRAEHLEISEPLDFALAFWMAHETPDVGSFFAQVRASLKPEGLLLVAEPRLHVTAEAFAQEIELARATGLLVRDEPLVRLSRAVVLARN
ncbi:MAG TPA: methyltransferase domain-containing protein [Desulfurivibrionaceae bacterium]|nr:methyltransferase domain-containing protein [Desulfurivibrionaceae bacterium]